MKKAVISLSLLCAVAIIIASCKKDKGSSTDPNAYTIATTMNGGKEVPANATTGSGTLTGTYNKATNKLTYTIAFTGLTGTSTAMHFHGPATTTVNAAVAIGLTINTPGAAGGATGEVTLTEAQEADLLAGMWYLNVHTAANPGGEIRGQVAATQ
jgi:hypothetical protein